MTPAGTSNELDVQNEWEENTHTLEKEYSTDCGIYIYILLFCKHPIQYYRGSIIYVTLKKCSLCLYLSSTYLKSMVLPTCAFATAEDGCSVCSRRVELAGGLGF